MPDRLSDIHVLLVDDEDDFRVPVGRFLRRQGLTVADARSTGEMRAVLSSFDPDIIVLDINLPGESGLDALSRLRAESRAGLILVSAQRGVEERVQGLTLGADSYLEKPIDLRELLAVIQNLWKRLADVPSRERENTWTFDSANWTLRAPDGVTVHLSAAEYAVITTLSKQPGQPVSRDNLFECQGKSTPGPDDRSLDVLISRIRRKFSESNHPFPLKSVRGVGYVFPSISKNS
jgi:DNA-binding response OmpR family regulator